MAEVKLSDDGLYYWDGSRWVSTLSPDGRWRWNGTAWVPLTDMVVPTFQAYQAYPQPAASRVPTRWTKPLQYATVAASIIYAAYTFSLPFWMTGTMSQAMNQAMQQQAAQNPDMGTPPPEILSTYTSMMTVTLWLAVFIVVALATVVIIGALKRWTWIFYAVLVLLGLSTLLLPFNIIGAVSGSSGLNVYSLPPWIYWASVGIGIPLAALFVCMLVAVIRYGPWAMPRRTDTPAAS
ncbi:MAG: hypothetical protein E6I73_04985 [Chloroflexi bacterium]|nr:MAG: hypothetical protein E6I73_04985 [Chloroflexota bacterium]